MANFREMRDPFTLYHSPGVINGKEFILEDIGRVTTMFTKPPPPLPSIRFFKIPTTPPSLVDSVAVNSR